MARLILWRGLLQDAKLHCALSGEEIAVVDDVLARKAEGPIPVNVDELPLKVVRHLLESPKLKPNERAILAVRVHGLRDKQLTDDRFYGMVVSSPLEFGSTLMAAGNSRANVELSWNGRWYPVRAVPHFHEDHVEKKIKFVDVVVTLGMGGFHHRLQWPVDAALFMDRNGDPRDLSMLEVFQELGFRPLQVSAGEFNLRLAKAERLSAESGSQVWVRSSVLDLSQRFLFTKLLTELPLGTPDMPRRAVVERTLESNDNDSYGRGFAGNHLNSQEDTSAIPLVRVFSLDTKSYVFADIDDLEVYDYDDRALDQLYLPPEMKSVLQKVFETPTDKLFGDLIRGKHGGIVVLACGSPGVGKTLTAEVYSEMTERPLYVLEFGELGTTVQAIEENLQKVFARIVCWNAVLQFDECEIFLTQRGNDLERSAIVGIFLRMLDYYEGILFLTTNRPEVLDDAILSRVMLRLEYPDLDQQARKKIWEKMFEAAELTLQGRDYGKLAEIEMDGRRIRNLVRLTRIVYPERVVTTDQIQALTRFGSH